MKARPDRFGYRLRLSAARARGTARSPPTPTAPETPADRHHCAARPPVIAKDSRWVVREMSNPLRAGDKRLFIRIGLTMTTHRAPADLSLPPIGLAVQSLVPLPEFFTHASTLRGQAHVAPS